MQKDKTWKRGGWIVKGCKFIFCMMKTKKDMVKSVEQGRRMVERQKGERVESSKLLS